MNKPPRPSASWVLLTLALFLLLALLLAQVVDGLRPPTTTPPTEKHR